MVISGLTFDLHGLAPAESAALPPMEHQFGVSFDPSHFRFEAIVILPSHHLAAGRATLPVVRTMIGLAAGMALPFSVKAVCWHPAQSWMEPGYFTRTVTGWLSGGPFPALGLTALKENETGGVDSTGLEFFAGQEIQVEAVAGEPRVETVQRASRVIDHIIRHGPLTSRCELDGPPGETVLAEPTPDGRYVRVWRSA